MHGRSARAFHRLYKNLALLCGSVCDRKMSPPKIGQCRYFWVFQTNQNKVGPLPRLVTVSARIIVPYTISFQAATCTKSPDRPLLKYVKFIIVVDIK